MAERSGLGGIPITGLIAVLAAIIGAVVWKSVPLDVRRPGASTPLPYQELGLQDVDARLWEDPFAAVARAIDGKAAPDERRLLPKVCESLRERVKGNVKLLVLGVTVSKAPYADGEEQRRRIRYAVVSALNVSHFVPENAEHLGYLRWSGDGGAIPFELFRRTNRSALGFDLVTMVLWLEEESFASVRAKGAKESGGAATPVLRMNQLALELKTSCSTPSDVLDEANYEFRVVGPAQSSTLKAMIEEMEREPDAETQTSFSGRPRLTHAEFYSPFATASETQLLRRRRSDEPAAPDALDRGPCKTTPREPDCSLNGFFATKGLRFLQTTSSDDRLVYSLVDELELRGVPVRTASSGAHHVALVSEWDTYYGRMLPSAFLRAAGLERVCETDLSEPQPLPSERDVECRILRFSYLRGLDGLAPGGTPAATQPAPKPLGRGEQPVELADGSKQFDYLRRLATQIQNENTRLQRAKLGEIGAIGVLGSDVYDKIAVLRALRASFPRAVFFTTDLDARLLNPDEYDWTRNLIVASAFGLELAPCLQRYIPPFRGSYQTAAFFATRVALYNAFPDANTFRDERCPQEVGAKPAAVAAPITQARLDTWLAIPRLYEIGRTRPIDLRDSAGGCPGLADCTDVHAHGGDLHNLRGLYAAFVLLAVLIGLLFLSRMTRPLVSAPAQLIVDAVRGRLPQGQRLPVLLPTILFLTFLGMLLLQMVGSVNDPTGEPFAWLEGVSAWPSELIRWFALLLGGCFLVYMFRAIERNDVELQEQFHIPFTSDTRTLWQRLRGQFHVGAVTRGTPRTGALWVQYLGSGHWSVLMLWALLWTIVFMALSSGLFALLGLPNHPIRGAAALRLDQILIMALVVIFQVLLFSVNAAIRLCGRFIDELIAQDDARDWPDEARRIFAQRSGFKPDIDPTITGEILDPWIDIRFIAGRTQAIGPLIYFPFVLLGLMVVARWSVFDDWDIPIALAIVFITTFAIACVNAFLMQRAAARARALALERLQALQLQSKGQAPGAYPIPAHLDAIAESVRSLRKGAFVPFTEQPLVRAALIPFGSAGGLYLVDLFALASS